jgi:hypothetical protein
MIAVAEGEWMLDLDTLIEAARLRWPRLVFVPATGRVAAVSLGQMQIPEPSNTAPELLVEIDPTGRALGLETPSDELAADFIAWITTLPGFPDDGSVVGVSLNDEIVPLTPSMTAERLLAIRARLDREPSGRHRHICARRGTLPRRTTT